VELRDGYRSFLATMPVISRPTAAIATSFKRHRVEVETLAGRLLPIRYRSSVERKSTRQTRTAAEAFVNVAALQTGARLDGKGPSRIARRIAELTGLPQALKEEKKLLISEMTYFFEALRPKGVSSAASMRVLPVRWPPAVTWRGRFAAIRI
jgi:hypothetical protein